MKKRRRRRRRRRNPKEREKIEKIIIDIINKRPTAPPAPLYISPHPYASPEPPQYNAYTNT